MDLLYDNLTTTNDRLTMSGVPVGDLAKKYGTPLMITDADRLVGNCARYNAAIAAYYGGKARALYASKAFCARGLYPIIAAEGLGADAVSMGELKIMVAAGFPMDRVCFHGNAKTDAALEYAIEHNVGHIVIDNFDELNALSEIASEAGKVAHILLRVSPGIDPHTFEAVKTGRVDSKFGIAIATGQAMEAVSAALEVNSIELDGFHCHIGSQIFESKPFVDAAKVMMRFISDVKAKTGYCAEILDIGGGIGVGPHCQHRRGLEGYGGGSVRECARIRYSRTVCVFRAGPQSDSRHDFDRLYGAVVQKHYRI